MGTLVNIAGRVGALLFLAIEAAGAEGATLDSARFKFEVRLEQLEKAGGADPTKVYREQLEGLGAVYRDAGNLDAVLEVRSVIEALDSDQAEPSVTLPKLRQLRDDYQRARTRAKVAGAAEKRKVMVDYQEQLGKIKARAGAAGDAAGVAAATAEIAKINEMKKAVEAVARFVPGYTMRGRFHIEVDYTVRIYREGKVIYKIPKTGNEVSPLLELTIGDVLLFSARNRNGGIRHLKTVFVSADEREVIEFRVADFVHLRRVLKDKDRTVTLEDLTSEHVLPAIRDGDREGNPFDFENRSEWVWGSTGDHALLGTAITPEMCRMR